MFMSRGGGRLRRVSTRSRVPLNVSSRNHRWEIVVIEVIVIRCGTGKILNLVPTKELRSISYTFRWTSGG